VAEAETCFESYFERLCLNISILIAIQSIGFMRLSVHDASDVGMTDAQHRLVRRLLGQALGPEHENPLAIEITRTITGDSGRVSVRGLTKIGASTIIEELIDARTKSITTRGRTIIFGIQGLIKAFPFFEEREAYIQGVETYMRNLRTAHHGATGHARGYSHERERARQLLERGATQYRRELRPRPPGWQEPRLMSFQSPYETGKRKGNKASA